ncbi:MAG: hypothetical protein KC503_28540, partial [Myxococcales bacterium]|nr:hypothetical protein [Myxococcales bacterium]
MAQGPRARATLAHALRDKPHQLLAEHHVLSARFTIHVVSHTHWDRAWYWTLEQTRVRLVDLMDGLLELLEGEPRYRCFTLDGQTAMIDDYLAVRPEQERRLAKLARAGRLAVGPLFVLPDLFIPDGESLVRNLQRGAARTAQLGGALELAYLPDPFGHPEQLPQVLSAFGLDGLLVARGLGDEGERLGSDFIWRAPDGSSVHVTHALGGGYCNLAGLGVAGEVDWGPRRGKGFARPAGNWTAPGDHDEQRALARVARRIEDMGAYCPHGQLLLMNGCDHRHPQPELPRLLDTVATKLGLRVAHDTPASYQRAVRSVWQRAGAAPRAYRGELRGGRYANLLSGVLSARVDIKLAHDRAERELLRWAEPLSALAAALDGGDDQRAQIAHAWREVLLCQPHDDICGCSVDGVHDDDHGRLRRAQQSAELLAERAARRVARVLDPGADERPQVVNPHPFRARALLRTAAQRPLLVECPPLSVRPLDEVALASGAVAPPRATRVGDGAVAVENGALSLS